MGTTNYDSLLSAYGDIAISAFLAAVSILALGLRWQPVALTWITLFMVATLNGYMTATTHFGFAIWLGYALVMLVGRNSPNLNLKSIQFWSSKTFVASFVASLLSGLLILTLWHSVGITWASVSNGTSFFLQTPMLYVVCVSFAFVCLAQRIYDITDLGSYIRQIVKNRSLLGLFGVISCCVPSAIFVLAVTPYDDPNWFHSWLIGSRLHLAVYGVTCLALLSLLLAICARLRLENPPFSKGYNLGAVISITIFAVRLFMAAHQIIH